MIVKTYCLFKIKSASDIILFFFYYSYIRFLFNIPLLIKSITEIIVLMKCAHYAVF